ncbi:carbohydrate kinase family protein [Deltaproteobacteria bacterium OttesenSCG-928-M10]|nr:carbohydrate kinase family protein [Deltaproteobacteria bacterium OttesenSCG-928-M10]
MTLICSGSLAFDRLLSVPGVFGDSLTGISPEMFNICLLVEKVKRTYGGTAGNVAYNLGLLGEKPLIVASLGDDPDGGDYRQRLAGLGLPLDAVITQKGRTTAGATIVTDSRDNMFNFFHPGAMNAATGFDPASLPGPVSDHLAIVSPGGAGEMLRLCRAYRSLGLKYIFDPGQQLPVFNPEELVDMLDGSFMFICNTFEFESYKSATGLADDDLFRHTEAIIVTRGSAGSDLLVPGRGSQHVGAVPVNQVVNATGAGDAFRAGLLAGLSRGEHLITACRLGATVAAFCVEADGTQDQHFTPAQVMARHASAFKEQINIL